MTDKGKVLITDKVDDLLIHGLQKLGYECDFRVGISQEEVDRIIIQFSGIVITTKTTLYKTTLEKAVKLKWIARAGSGMEIVDVEYAKSKNIICLNSPEGNRNSVGEHALGLLLALTHNIVRSSKQTEKLIWQVEENRVIEISGMIVGIIGYGNTGSAFAEKLKMFGVQILAYDKYKTNFGNEFVKECELKELFELCDVVSLHVPLTNETLHLANENFFNQFKKKIYFLNTSRGKVVDTSALLNAIFHDKITGAGIDVLENENFSSHTSTEKNLLEQLIITGKTIITPHVAGKSFSSQKRFAAVLLSKIKEVEQL